MYAAYLQVLKTEPRTVGCCAEPCGRRAASPPSGGGAGVQGGSAAREGAACSCTGSPPAGGALRPGARGRLAPIPWPLFAAWVEARSRSSHDHRFRAACSALALALKVWRRRAGTEGARGGVSLTALYRWIWPQAAPGDVAAALTCICLHELEKLRQPTPRLISPEERGQLRRVFEELDPQGRGYCTAVDIAGGTAPDIATRLKTLVDVDTAKAVFGDGRVDLELFLEFMCDDGYRGHEGVTRVPLRDGQVLRRHSKEGTIPFGGWLLEGRPGHEEEQRLLIEALEVEASRWRCWAAEEQGGARRT